MPRRLAFAALFVALGATVAFAAPLAGRIAIVSKPHVCIVVKGKPDAWIKKGAFARVLGGRATVVNVVPDTICVTTPNAAKAKAGASVTIEKPRATAAGC